jgi:hypothetical protein
MVLKWEDPSPDGRRGSRKRRSGGTTDWSGILDELRRRPGVWALVGIAAPASMSTYIKDGCWGRAEPGEFEATTRDQIAGRGKVYARYVGVSS